MAARHRSRKRALQVLFEWDMRKDSIDRAISHYYDSLYSEEGENRPKPDKFMEELARGTVANAGTIDKQIEAKSEHWRLERMAVVDRNILRLAIFEFSQGIVPPPVIIDEAIELARQFSNDESISFINGVLDAVRKQSATAQAEHA
jgi:N utilization substance protein B